MEAFSTSSAARAESSALDVRRPAALARGQRRLGFHRRAAQSPQRARSAPGFKLRARASKNSSFPSFDDLVRLIPSPGLPLAPYDLMFSTDSRGASDPELLREYIRQHSDGPPRFMSPAVWLGTDVPRKREELPLMLYLPGLDGSGICAARQFPLLQESFDLRKLVIPLKDRTPFAELVRIVKEYLEVETNGADGRPVYILGESFGGILALAVAATARDKIDRVVLVNPATSFPRSIWPAFGPVLSQLPGSVYSAAPFALMPLLGDPIKMASFYISGSAPPNERLEYLAQGLVSMIPLLGMIPDLLPSDTLEWKIKILSEGADYTMPMYNQVTMPVLVIAGDADLLIPSQEESCRLAWRLPDCKRRLMPGHSHILMQEEGVNVGSIIKEEGFYTAYVRDTTESATGGSVNEGTSEALDTFVSMKQLEIAV